MNLSDFDIGQWYKTNVTSQYFFKVLGINTQIYCKTKEQHLDVLAINDKLVHNSYITNKSYWEGATPISQNEIEHLLPVEYKETNVLIFN